MNSNVCRPFNVQIFRCICKFRYFHSIFFKNLNKWNELYTECVYMSVTFCLTLWCQMEPLRTKKKCKYMFCENPVKALGADKNFFLALTPKHTMHTVHYLQFWAPLLRFHLLNFPVCALQRKVIRISVNKHPFSWNSVSSQRNLEHLAWSIMITFVPTENKFYHLKLHCRVDLIIVSSEPTAGYMWPIHYVHPTILF